MGRFFDIRQRPFEDLKLWRPAMVNHLYGTAASTPYRDPDGMEVRWQSRVNHVQDIPNPDTWSGWNQVNYFRSPTVRGHSSAVMSSTAPDVRCQMSDAHCPDPASGAPGMRQLTSTLRCSYASTQGSISRANNAVIL
ncbi:unnamed protein product [Lota lota]